MTKPAARWAWTGLTCRSILRDAGSGHLRGAPGKRDQRSNSTTAASGDDSLHNSLNLPAGQIALQQQCLGDAGHRAAEHAFLHEC